MAPIHPATQDGTFDGGQRLEQCTQGVLSELGHPYQARRIPHFRIVSPLRYVAPESGRVVVGGFNQYRAEDLQVRDGDAGGAPSDITSGISIRVKKARFELCFEGHP